MVDDDEDGRSPSPEPRMDSRSGLPVKNRRWWRLRIVKRDETSSPIFSPKIGIYSAGNRARGTRAPQPTRAHLEGVERLGVLWPARAPPPVVLGSIIFFIF